MKILELFSGTGSVGKVCKLKGWEVVSLDLKDADINIDILNWDYKIYPENHFNIIWASPPCTEYSILKNNTGMNTNILLADQIVLKTIEIINYFKPDKWFIENPQTGLLKKRNFMQNFNFNDFDYCCFSDWGYKKRTRIWSNTNQINELCKKENCPNMTGKFHKCSFGGQGRKKDHTYISVKAGTNAHRIPFKLIKRLFNII
jgi:site-specific DNA-cytosine methylase